MSLLDDSVTKVGGGWDFNCPVNDGTCGDRKTKVPFTSTGWPTKESARARAQQHFADHKGEAPMQSLEDFRAEHGLDVNEDGQAIVRAKDLP